MLVASTTGIVLALLHHEALIKISALRLEHLGCHRRADAFDRDESANRGDSRAGLGRGRLGRGGLGRGRLGRGRLGRGGLGRGGLGRGRLDRGGLGRRGLGTGLRNSRTRRLRLGFMIKAEKVRIEVRDQFREIRCHCVYSFCGHMSELPAEDLLECGEQGSAAPNHSGLSAPRRLRRLARVGSSSRWQWMQPACQGPGHPRERKPARSCSTKRRSARL